MKSRPWPPYWQTPATPAPSASTLIQDETGQSWFLELNARIFGSWMGLQLAGVNFVAAYQYAFGMGEAHRGPA